MYNVHTCSFGTRNVLTKFDTSYVLTPNLGKLKESKGIRFSKCFKEFKNLSSIQDLSTY